MEFDFYTIGNLCCTVPTGDDPEKLTGVKGWKLHPKGKGIPSLKGIVGAPKDLVVKDHIKKQGYCVAGAQRITKPRPK